MPTMSVLSHCQSAPKYTLKGRPGELRKAATPGPGAYIGDKAEHVKFGAAPKHSFGGGVVRDADRPQTAPGPGQYTPIHSARSGRQAAAHSFGTSTRRSRSVGLETPGPGQYQSSPRVGVEGPNHTFGTRRDVQVGTPSPGPAAYEHIDHSSTSKAARMPKHSFGRSSRDNFRLVSAPGPGQYDGNHGHVKQKTAQYTFGTSSGRKEPVAPTDPGPGHYNHSPRIGMEGPKYSAASRSARQLNRLLVLSPGPGAYTTDPTTTKFAAGPKFGFGSGSRENLGSTAAPGPGAYNPMESKQLSPRHVFGSSTRGTSVPAKEPTPGPGTYALAEKLGKEGPKFSAGGKAKQMGETNGPGPGSYEHDHIRHPLSPKYGFGSAIRTSPRKHTVPGPGSYQEKHLQRGPTHTFGQRANIIHETRTPGPGAHEHTSMF